MSTDPFIEEHRELVESLAKKVRFQFEVHSLGIDELIAAGFEGLLKSKDRYDPARGVKFSTFAYYRIRGAMIDSVRRNSVLSARMAAKLKAMEAADSIAEGFGPSRTNAKPVEQIGTVTDFLKQATAVYLMASASEECNATPEEALLEAESKDLIAAGVDALPEREKALIQGYYFEGRPFEEVAKELNISKSWASRLHAKALSRLKKSMRGRAPT